MQLNIATISAKVSSQLLGKLLILLHYGRLTVDAGPFEITLSSYATLVNLIYYSLTVHKFANFLYTLSSYKPGNSNLKSINIAFKLVVKHFSLWFLDLLQYFSCVSHP